MKKKINTEISNNVIASGGNYSINSGFTISSTIGEAITTTLSSGSNILTQGFQQSYNTCTSPVPSGLSVNWKTDTKAEITWDNMNLGDCMVWKYYIRYRELGAASWVTKSAGVGNGLCNFGLLTTIKRLQNLIPDTTYEYKMKAFYCGGTESAYSAPSQFTTKGDCPEMGNLTVQTFNGNEEKATFSWNASMGQYLFARVALRVDSTGMAWQTAGGNGVYYPTFEMNKFGLTPGESYRAQCRTFNDSNVTSYCLPFTSPPIFWTQPGSLVKKDSNKLKDK